MGSSRFPGKPLALIAGKPMILHTLERARQADCFQQIFCATDHIEIAKVVEDAGFRAILTPDCKTGSDRVAFVASLLHLELVVNLQGDEPVASLTLLRQVSEALSWDSQSWVTAMSPLQSADLQNPNVVKVQVIDGFAKAFTRRAVQGEHWFSHRGIYAYSYTHLQEFASLPQAPSEQDESLEQLRIFPQTPIRAIFTSDASLSVDRPSDIAAVESFLLRS